MGEVVFTPLYRALTRKERDQASGEEKQRVNVQFFHRVKNLGLSRDHRRIATIEVERQALLRNPANGYQPTIRVPLATGPFECWPSAPLVDQLETTTLPDASDSGFESSWSHHSGASLTLRDGVDFDDVILAIPPQAHPHIASELIAASPRWQRMVEQVKSIRTVAAQLWLLPKPSDLGWDPKQQFLEPPLLGGYVEPLNILMDEEVVLHTETWPLPLAPKSLFYLCGPMREPTQEGDFSDATYPESQTVLAREIARTWFSSATEMLWPKASIAGTGGLNWDLAFDPESRNGQARFQGQYVRCNIDPAERYVLSLAGSTGARIGHPKRRDGNGYEMTDFENLYVAGDWTRNGINVGCVEAATVSGMQAARAICGEPVQILGEEDVAAH